MPQMALSDMIAGRTYNWIATHRHHGRTIVANIRRKLSEESSFIFQ
jgi:hypothetical protein